MLKKLIAVLLVVCSLCGEAVAVEYGSRDKNYQVAAVTVSKNQENMVARADWVYNITWVAQQTVEGWGGTFKKGNTYHIPYGQPIMSGKYIGYSATYEEFLEAAATAGSIFYTGRSWCDGTTAPYYATDCSSFVSWVWGIARTTTYFIPNVSTNLGNVTTNRATYTLQLGDALNSSSHVVIVSGLEYDSSGAITQIEITEQTPPQMKRSYYSPYQLYSKYSNYTIQRYYGDVPNCPGVEEESWIEKATFDPWVYKNRYDDLKDRTDEQLKAHWLAYGIKEGRCASAILDLKYYVENNPDLKAAYGTDYAKAYQHFITKGYQEQRKSSLLFDGSYYCNRYPEVKSSFKENYLRHYVQNGMKEGRRASANFDVNYYLFTRPDVAKTWPDDLERAARHYAGYGIKEGRAGYDSTFPTITDVTVTDVSAAGYTVTCKVTDDWGVSKVAFPTWTVAGDQDDILWGEATVSGDKATFNVSFSSHNFEYGTYSTHIYATDLAGNYEMYPVTVEVPPVLAETPVSGTVGENTYFIASSLNKNYVLDVSGISLDNRANIHLWNTLGSSKNQMWKISDADGDGYYTIISVNSGKSLDADSAGTTDGTNVQQYEFNGTDAQLWKLEENADGTYRIINKNSGLSLDLDAGILANGQNIHLYTANDSGAQKWYLIPADTTGPVISDVQFSEISSEGFRVTCTVEDISAIQKVEFPAWTTNNGQDDQVWHAATVSGNTATCYISTADHKLESGAYEIHIYAHDTPGNYTGIKTGGVTVPNRIGNDPVDGKLDSGTYFIASSQNQNYAVDVEGISTENSANVYLWQTSGNNLNQMWQISDADGDGYYTVVALHSGKYLDVLGGIAVSGTNVQQYEANYSDAQLWQIVPNDDGTYCLYSKCGGFALDLAFGEVSNGTNIRIHDANGTVAQKWYLVPAKLSADTAHTHTYVNAVVTEPTCTEGGYTTHSCANCGEQYVDDYVSAAGHSFVEGICTVCGEADPDYVAPVTLTAKGFSLSFEDEILVNFYYTISDETNIAEHGMLMFEELPTVISVDGADAVYSKPIYDTIKAGYGVTTTGIAAKEMGDTRYYVAYAKLNDGTYIYSGAYDYSPKKYAMNMLGRESTSDKQKALCVAMLNFGAAAQVYFGYNTDALMNAELTEEQKALVMDYDAELFKGTVPADASKQGDFGATAGFSGKAATVSFDGAFAINYYFTPDAAVAGDMTLYIWNAGDYAAVSQLTAANASDVVSMEQQPNGSYWGQAAGIAAKALDETYYVAGVYTDANGNRCCTGVVAYSLSKYCMNNAAPGKDMQSLAANTAMYGYYAKVFFETKS